MQIATNAIGNTCNLQHVQFKTHAICINPIMHGGEGGKIDPNFFGASLAAKRHIEGFDIFYFSYLYVD